MISYGVYGDKEGALVVANVGNTNARFLLVEGGAIAWERQFASREPATWDLPDLPESVGVMLVSVVPAANAQVISRYGERVRVLAASTAPMPIRYETAATLGADRIANAAGLIARWGWGIAVDLGTATTLTVVDREGALVGGAIMPGLATARDSLFAGTAQLPAVELAVPDSPWGTSTLGSLQVGLVHGHVGAVVHLVSRMRGALPGAPVALTGGFSRFLAPLLPEDYHLAPDLTIEGAIASWPDDPLPAPRGRVREGA